MTTTAQLTLPALPESISVARRFVVAALRDARADLAADDAATLVSELATNALLHARTTFTVEVQLLGEVVRIAVLDLSTAVPRVRDYGADATTGRGMRLVSAMATRWGVEPSADGKAVWFELPAQGAVELVAEDEDSDPQDVLAAFPDAFEPEGRAPDTPRVWGLAA
ncbi:MAG: ATP-binding region ATPase domain protein [Frankiales bacterium]|nr:ATP-binding region ATPase domain protein [Frankiales bacterium]